ncbi:ABC transporter permease [Georgenia sp. Z1491]|uniref:ABC transporter permease n=1 Tax=Georgenia sp. Z1491 TaxID=3416707 RepID=UPI003CED60FD
MTTTTTETSSSTTSASRVRTRTRPPGRSGWGKRPSIWTRVPQLVSVTGFVVVLFALWYLVTRTGLVSEFVLPNPLDVIGVLGEMGRDIASGGFLAQALWITILSSLLAFAVSAVLGIGFGVLVAESDFGRVVLMPLLVAVNAAPKIVFAPVFIAALGFGINSKIALGAFIAFFPLLVDTVAGLASVDRDKQTLFRSLRMSSTSTFFKLKLPSSLPFIFAGLKTASVLSVIGVVVGEFIGGGEGLGQQTKIAGDMLATDRVYAYGIALAVFGYLFYALVVFAERKIVFWQSPHGDDK